MLKHRLFSGISLVCLLLLLVWLDEVCANGEGLLARGLLLALFTIGLVIPLLVLELSAMLARVQVRLNTWVAVLGAMGLCLSMWLTAAVDATYALPVGLTVLVLALACAFLESTRGRGTRGVLAAMAGTVFCVVYAGGLLGFWLMLRQSHGAWILFGAILTVKMSDIGAYAVGCSVGRHKLIPWLSPKKTWEGLAGGVVTAGLSGGLLAWASLCMLPESDHFPIWWGALFGVLAALLGLIGDLLASAMKRDAGLKDSSTILPGLGGIVDTLDSLLLVGPLAWWMLH